MLLLTTSISDYDQGQASVNSRGQETCPCQFVQCYFPIAVVHGDFCSPKINRINKQIQNITTIMTMTMMMMMMMTIIIIIITSGQHFDERLHRWLVNPSGCEWIRPILTQSKTRFLELGPTWVSQSNSISIGSAVFAGLTNVTNRQTDRPHIARCSVCSNITYLIQCMLCSLIIITACTVVQAGIKQCS